MLDRHRLQKTEPDGTFAAQSPESTACLYIHGAGERNIATNTIRGAPAQRRVCPSSHTSLALPEARPEVMRGGLSSFACKAVVEHVWVRNVIRKECLKECGSKKSMSTGQKVPWASAARE